MNFTLDQFVGCLLGLATGDALGAPHEGGTIERLVWRLIGQPRMVAAVGRTHPVRRRCGYHRCDVRSAVGHHQWSFRPAAGEPGGEG
jgi:hypothetical protein